MVNRLQSWVFISLSMLLMGFALFPVLRVIVGVDDDLELLLGLMMNLECSF